MNASAYAWRDINSCISVFVVHYSGESLAGQFWGDFFKAKTFPRVILLNNALRRLILPRVYVATKLITLCLFI